MKDYMTIPTDKPIILPQVGTTYYYVQGLMAQGRFRARKCIWQGYMTDRLRYISNYYTSEVAAKEAAQKLNKILKCMYQPEQASIY